MWNHFATALAEMDRSSRQAGKVDDQMDSIDGWRYLKQAQIRAYGLQTEVTQVMDG